MRSYFSVAALLIVISGTALAQWRDPIDLASSVQERGEFDKAQSILRSGRLQCRTIDKDCHARFDFALAYSFQKEAARQSDAKRSELLLSAIAEYDSVLKIDAGNWDALYNKGIALRDLGEWRNALTALGEAAAASRSQEVAGEVRVEMADIARDAGHSDIALNLYLEAYRFQNGAETPALRAIDMLTDLLDRTESAERSRCVTVLSELANRMRINSPSVSSLAFRALLIAEGTSVDREAMFLRWLTTTVDADSFVMNSVASLAPKVGVPSSALDALRQPIKQAEIRKSWWWGSPLRRHTLAHVWFANGKRLAPAEAATAWEYAKRVAPVLSDYRRAELVDDRRLPLDIALELVQLYHSEPTLDAKGRKFRSVEATLLGHEFVAYTDDDLELAQRLYTTMGLIYAERRSRTGSATANVIEQLNKALNIAERRQAREKGLHEPLPHVRIALATAYEHSGDRASSDRLLLMAARDYVDLDAYTDALDVIARIQEAHRPTADELQKIVTGRVAVATLERDAFDKTKEIYIERDPSFRWLRVDPQGEPATFVKRQRFKTFVDLAVKARRFNLAQAAKRYAEDAWNNADPTKSVTSAQDVMRIERLHYLTNSLRDVTRTSSNSSGVQPAHYQFMTVESAPDLLRAQTPEGWTIQLAGRTVPVHFQEGDEVFEDVPAENLDGVLFAHTVTFKQGEQPTVLRINDYGFAQQSQIKLMWNADASMAEQTWNTNASWRMITTPAITPVSESISISAEVPPE